MEEADHLLLKEILALHRLMAHQRGRWQLDMCGNSSPIKVNNWSTVPK